MLVHSSFFKDLLSNNFLRLPLPSPEGKYLLSCFFPFRDFAQYPSFPRRGRRKSGDGGLRVLEKKSIVATYCKCVCFFPLGTGKDRGPILVSPCPLIHNSLRSFIKVEEERAERSTFPFPKGHWGKVKGL